MLSLPSGEAGTRLVTGLHVAMEFGLYHLRTPQFGISEDGVRRIVSEDSALLLGSLSC